METADALARAAGLRNVVAHGYAAADVGSIFDAATAGLSDLESFATEVATWIRDQIGSEHGIE